MGDGVKKVKERRVRDSNTGSDKEGEKRGRRRRIAR